MNNSYLKFAENVLNFQFCPSFLQSNRPVKFSSNNVRNVFLIFGSIATIFSKGHPTKNATFLFLSGSTVRMHCIQALLITFVGTSAP